MSEIFSWLQKSEVEKKSGTAVVTETVLPPVEMTLVKPRQDTKFDLAGADQRIRYVLDPLTETGEHYRLLRAKLSQLQKERGLRTLLVSSTVPQEGKTFTACCLAGVFAQEPGKKVLLIDADLRKPRAGKDLGIDSPGQAPGLSQVLRGEIRAEDALLGSSDQEFFLLPAGPVPGDPAELLSSPLLEETIRSMSTRFDWVVVDSPPVLALADVSLIAPLCDAVLLIVRSGRTPSKMVKEAVERLGKDKICGIVLNRGRYPKSSKYYYSYYSHYGKNKRKQR